MENIAIFNPICSLFIFVLPMIGILPQERKLLNANCNVLLLIQDNNHLQLVII